MNGEISITPSLQNYIEVLFELNQQDAQVRVTDLAQRLSIAKSSVNQAITQLVKLGFALHEKYGRVELTEKGLTYAGDLQKRHRILQTFFADILHVDAEIANQDACIIEHVISQATMAKLTEYLEEREDLSGAVAKNEVAVQLTTLDKLLPGLVAKVSRITARGALRKRILDMGLTAGTEILVKKVAPMGDPIEIGVKGYSLAMRRSEAATVIVEIGKPV